MIKNKILNNVDIQLIIFVFLVPFINIYDFFIGEKIQVLGLSLIEILKILMICYLTLITIISKKDKIKSIYKNHKILCISFIFLCIIFVIFHILSIKSFNTSLISNASNNIFVEFYFIIRTYGVLLLLLFCFMISDIKRDKIIKIISEICFLVCSIIVISNIFKIGYVAYSSYLEKETIVSGNIFEWLTKLNASNADLYTTKGYFFSTNQMSLVILPSLAISMLYMTKSKKKILYFTFIIKVLGALMLSTKTCSFGVIILLLFQILGYPIYNLIKHQKIDKLNFIYFTLILLTYVPLLLISPVAYKTNLYQYNKIDSNANSTSTNNQDMEQLTIVKIQDYSDEKFVKKLESSYYLYGIHNSFIKMLPINSNITFWRNALKLTMGQRQDFRQFKKYIYNNIIKENNQEVKNYLFGIGYVSNFPYLERDFIGQNIWFGILGTILLIGPYIIIFLLALYKIISKIKKNFTLDNIYFSVAIALNLCASYLAGHLFGNLFPTIILILLLKGVCEVYNEKTQV